MIYLLFLVSEDEASGGINDLALVGTMAECMTRAEASDHDQLAQIVQLDSLTRTPWVRRGGWTYDPSPIAGQPITWAYVWEAGGPL